MPNKVIQLFPSKKAKHAKKTAVRVMRLERLLKTACKLLSQSETSIIIWPKDLTKWYEINVPDKPLTFEDAINELTEEQITALGLWAEEDDPDEAA